MNFKLPLIAATFAIASLTACGGGSDAPTPAPMGPNPAALTMTDTTIGTGVEASNGKTVKVNYTGYLYSTTAVNFKGTQFDTSIGASTFTVTLGAHAVIPGFEQGIVGMKVGGKRTILIPSSLGYGAAGGGGGKIPANTGLVFDVDLVEVL